MHGRFSIRTFTGGYMGMTIDILYHGQLDQSTWPWYGNTMEFYWERTEHGGFSNVFNISVSFQKHPPKMDKLHKFTGNSGQTLVNRCEKRLFRFASSSWSHWHDIQAVGGSCWGMTSRTSSSNVWSRTQSSWKICLIPRLDTQFFWQDQWEFHAPYFWPYLGRGYFLKFRPYIGLIYGRYLQFRFLKWPLTGGLQKRSISEHVVYHGISSQWHFESSREHDEKNQWIETDPFFRHPDKSPGLDLISCRDSAGYSSQADWICSHPLQGRSNPAFRALKFLADWLYNFLGFLWQSSLLSVKPDYYPLLNDDHPNRDS